MPDDVEPSFTSPTAERFRVGTSKPLLDKWHDLAMTQGEQLMRERAEFTAARRMLDSDPNRISMREMSFLGGIGDFVAHLGCREGPEFCELFATAVAGKLGYLPCQSQKNRNGVSAAASSPMNSIGM